MAYFLAKGKARSWVMLTGSYFFYGWWDWRFLFLIALLTLVNFFAGRGITRAEKPTQKKRWISFSLLSSLGTLAYFKYFEFFIVSVQKAFNQMGWVTDPVFMEIILPVGISFYTFQTMSYTIDLYRGKIEEEKSLLNFAVYVAFFPQLVAGPIIRARDFLPQLKEERKAILSHVVTGLCLVCGGFVMKSVYADSLALVVEDRFDNPLSHSSLSLFIGVVFYAFQIYGDFSGYSLIAIGLARILGFEFPRNFDRPYFSSSFSDFWKRWHISLSSWLRDYLYIPLGGNRKGIRRTYINLMLTMVLGGLWHGAAWTFVFWGFLHGLYLCLQRVFHRFTSKIPFGGLVGIPVVFLATIFAWIFFRAPDLQSALDIIERILIGGSWSFGSITQKFHIVKGASLIAVLVLAEALSFRVNLWALAEKHRWLYGVFIVLCLWALSLFGTFGNDSFIYFQF
ncbi:MBOAT family protein [Akkermansiaceae bacterium]|nr:MBOAT family protein [Akkermansiaceae bacterium]